MSGEQFNQAPLDEVQSKKEIITGPIQVVGVEGKKTEVFNFLDSKYKLVPVDGQYSIEIFEKEEQIVDKRKIQKEKIHNKIPLTQNEEIFDNNQLSDKVIFVHLLTDPSDEKKIYGLVVREKNKDTNQNTITFYPKNSFDKTSPVTSVGKNAQKRIVFVPNEKQTSNK